MYCGGMGISKKQWDRLSISTVDMTGGLNFPKKAGLGASPHPQAQRLKMLWEGPTKELGGTPIFSVRGGHGRPLVAHAPFDDTSRYFSLD